MNKQELLKAWYHKYSHDIYRFIVMLTGEHDRAKDLTQDTFIRAFKHIDKFRGESTEKTWLFQIARNLSIDYLKLKKPFSYLISYIPLVKTEAPAIDNQVVVEEDIEHFYRSLKKLSRDYQEVIIIRKIKEFSISETAEILNWKQSKVKTKLHRGLKELKKELIKEGYEHGSI